MPASSASVGSEKMQMPSGNIHGLCVFGCREADENALSSAKFELGLIRGGHEQRSRRVGSTKCIGCREIDRTILAKTILFPGTKRVTTAKGTGASAKAIFTPSRATW